MTSVKDAGSTPATSTNTIMKGSTMTNNITVVRPEIHPCYLVDEIQDLIDDRHRLDWLIESAKIDLSYEVGDHVMTYTREHIDQAMEQEDDDGDLDRLNQDI